jgi:hypothetical protein
MITMTNLATNENLSGGIPATGVTLEWLKSVLDEAGYTTEINDRGLVARHPTKYSFIIGVKDFLKIVVTDVLLRVHRKPEAGEEKAFLDAINSFNFRTDFISIAAPETLGTLCITSHMSIGEQTSAEGFLRHLEMVSGLISANLPNDPLGAYLR